MHPALEKSAVTPPPFRIDFVWLNVKGQRVNLTRVDAYYWGGLGTYEVFLLISGHPQPIHLSREDDCKALVDALDAHFYRVGQSIEDAKERRSLRG